MRRTRSTRFVRGLAGALALVAIFALASPAGADEYDARRAGHPLRVAGYILHPIGVALDWLIFRPAHFVGSQPVLRTIFGHDIDEEPQR